MYVQSDKTVTTTAHMMSQDVGPTPPSSQEETQPRDENSLESISEYEDGGMLLHSSRNTAPPEAPKHSKDTSENRVHDNMGTDTGHQLPQTEAPVLRPITKPVNTNSIIEPLHQSSLYQQTFKGLIPEKLRNFACATKIFYPSERTI